MFPSWIKSKNSIPLPTYFFAILTTNLKFDSANFCLASSSPSITFFANSNSSSKLSNGIFPISLKYILTGSSTLIPSKFIVLISSTFMSSTFSNSSTSGSSSKSSFSTSTPISSNASNTLSICSGFISPNSVASSPYVIFPFALAFCTISFTFLVASSFVSLAGLSVFSFLLLAFKSSIISSLSFFVFAII